jgi:hypothetical protein
MHETGMLVFANHLGHLDATGRHTHLLRDWSGAMISGNILYPPMEMLYAAAYLRRQGCDVALVDGSVRHWPHHRTIAAVLAHRPSHVITVSGWYNLQDDLAFLGALKTAAPQVRTIRRRRWLRRRSITWRSASSSTALMKSFRDASRATSPSAPTAA